jgi:hypothetical protein
VLHCTDDSQQTVEKGHVRPGRGEQQRPPTEDSLYALDDLNGRLEKRKSQGLFYHLAVSRQQELEHGTSRYAR